MKRGNDEEPLADLLEQFRSAKKAKNYAVSDKIREQIRKMGVDPDADPRVNERNQPDGMAPPQIPVPPIHNPMMHGQATPPMYYAPPPVGAGYDAPQDQAQTPESQVLMDEWLSAKKSKDWDKADELREKLRAMGVEPDPTTRDRRPVRSDSHELRVYRSYGLHSHMTRGSLWPTQLRPTRPFNSSDC